MTRRATIIDGRALAAAHRAEIATRARALASRGRAARLDAVLVDSGDSAARVYAENQGRMCAQVGIEYRLHELPAGAALPQIVGKVQELNGRPEVAGIMVHLPLPDGIDAYAVQRLIDPVKDVEGVNPANIGNIVYGRSSLVPCTALATLRMIESTYGRGVTGLRGRRAVVVGASDVVGKPIAVLLMRQEATVVSCNVWTENLPSLTREADVLVSAAGVPGLVKGAMVRPGAVVIDVGVSRVAGPDGEVRTVGDVAFEEVSAALASDPSRGCGWVSPVPGGVGPMTVAMLLRNVVEAGERQAEG